MELLGGTKERVVLEEKKEKEETDKMERNEEEKEEITKEELVKQLRKLKKGKAPGENGIENEAWRLMPGVIEEVFLKLINKIWKEGGVLEEWNSGLISPMYKKGEKGEVKNYREVTLMNTAYKIYANILNERLKKEVEKTRGRTVRLQGRKRYNRRNIRSELCTKQRNNKRGKVSAFFADLKAAFDKVDRTKLGKMLKKAVVDEQLRRRIMETYRETKNRVKVGRGKSEEFWTKSGVRQGCPISPTLFNIYLMDLEAEQKGTNRQGGSR